LAPAQSLSQVELWVKSKSQGSMNPWSLRSMCPLPRHREDNVAAAFILVVMLRLIVAKIALALLALGTCLASRKRLLEQKAGSARRCKQTQMQALVDSVKCRAGSASSCRKCQRCERRRARGTTFKLISVFASINDHVKTFFWVFLICTILSVCTILQYGVCTGDNNPFLFSAYSSRTSTTTSCSF
jgi:hypothetical protein